MDGSSLVALAELLKPPEEDRESDDVRIAVRSMARSLYAAKLIFMSGKGRADTLVCLRCSLTEQMILIIRLICSHTHLLRLA